MTGSSLWGALDSLGFEVLRTLLSVLWQSSVLFAAVAGLSYVLRRRRASVRHALWIAALLVAPTLPVLAWLGSSLGTPQAPLPVMPTYSSPRRAPYPSVAPPSTLVPDKGLQPLAPLAPTAPVMAPIEEEESFSLAHYPWALALLVYGAGAALLFGLVVLGRVRLSGWLRRGTVVTDEGVLAAFREARQGLGVARDLVVVESEQARAPMTIGSLHPAVLLPKGFTQGLRDADLRAVALHEMAHVRRHDPLLLTVASLVRAALFFHPLVWLACRQVSRLAEQSADDAVLDATGRPIEYAKMLTRIAENLRRAPLTTELAAGIVLSKSAFLRRVEAILSDRRHQIRKLSRLALLGTVAGALLSLALATAVPLSEKPVEPALTQEGETAPPEAPEGTVPETERRIYDVRDLLSRPGEEELTAEELHENGKQLAGFLRFIFETEPAALRPDERTGEPALLPTIAYREGNLDVRGTSTQQKRIADSLEEIRTNRSFSVKLDVQAFVIDRAAIPADHRKLLSAGAPEAIVKALLEAEFTDYKDQTSHLPESKLVGTAKVEERGWLALQPIVAQALKWQRRAHLPLWQGSQTPVGSLAGTSVGGMCVLTGARDAYVHLQVVRQRVNLFNLAATVPDGGVLVALEEGAKARAIAAVWAGEEAVKQLNIQDCVVVLLARPHIIQQQELEVTPLPSAPKEEPEATSHVEEFGISRGEPIDRGFLFSVGKYIDAPYVVERRGLDIYVNDVLVRTGPKWPPYDYRVQEDPGEPPPGSSPFDPTPPGMHRREMYWSRKWRYLASHYDYEAAKQRMIETYRSSSDVRAVLPVGDVGESVELVSNSGKRRSKWLMATERYLDPPASREEVLAEMDRGREHYERTLQGNMILFKVSSGLELGASGKQGLRTLEILLSEASDAEKIEALRDIGLLPEHDDPKMEKIVTEFEASPQLAERVSRRNQLLEREKRQEVLALTSHVSEDLPARVENPDFMLHAVVPLVKVARNSQADSMAAFSMLAAIGGEALPQLKQAFADGTLNLTSRGAAAVLLVHLGDVSGWSVLERIVQDGSRSEMNVTVGRMGDLKNRVFLPLIEKALQRADAEQGVSYAAAYCGGQDAIPILEAALNHPNEGVRYGAGIWLRKLRGIEEKNPQGRSGPATDLGPWKKQLANGAVVELLGTGRLLNEKLYWVDTEDSLMSVPGVSLADVQGAGNIIVLRMEGSPHVRFEAYASERGALLKLQHWFAGDDNVWLVAAGDRKYINLKLVVSTDPDPELAVESTGESIEFHNLRISPSLEVPPDRRGKEGAVFGPVLELMLPPAEPVSFVFLDLDTGKLLLPPSQLKASHGGAPLNVTTLAFPDELRSWIRQNRVDAVVHVDGESVGFRALEMNRAPESAGLPLHFGSWDGISAAAVEGAFGDTRLSKSWTPFQMVLPTEGLPYGFAFRTREGGTGVLQLFEAPGEVGAASVAIRYKMLQSEALIPPGPPPGFGPVIEPDLWEGGGPTYEDNCVFDLDTGEWLWFRGYVSWFPRARWKKEDLAFGAPSYGSKVWGLNLAVVSVPDASWDTMPAEEVTERLRGATATWRVPTLLAAGGLPATYLFSTLEGGTGILQLFDRSLQDHPQAIGIRHKMLEGKAGEAAAAAERAWRRVVLRDPDKEGAEEVLDLKTGEMLPIAELGSQEEEALEFVKLGKGDLAAGGLRHLIVFRDGQAASFVNGEARPLDVRGGRPSPPTVRYFGLPPLPCQLLVTTGDGAEFEVTVLSATKQGMTVDYRPAGAMAD